MLRINRLRVEINTVNGVYGIDTSFSSGLNFIASEDNTCGKSSILAAIYYCLGLEQIIGGTGGIGSKVLTSVFKSEIEDNQNSYRVLESGAYLEISNGYDTVTIYRNIVSESKDNRLVSVYYSTYDAIKDQKTQVSDFYVNIQNAATSEKGFHNFLEEFLHISLPMVGTSDGNERKLYLQIKSIRNLEKDEDHITTELSFESDSIQHLEKDIALIDADIRNNNDAARLQNFGSDNSTDNCSSICPVCNQEIHDNMILAKSNFVFMDIEANILHLKEQKKMLAFALDNRQARKGQLEQEKLRLAADILTLRRLAQALRSDLYMTTDNDSSEAIVLRKIEISGKIEESKKLQKELDKFLLDLDDLSEQWQTYLAHKAKLPKHDKSDADVEKIRLLKSKFIENLKLYHYSSVSDLGAIDISEESLLPTIDGFDMKFDSSASDGIRVIWAFTMALLQVSLEKGGNHPGIIIFDEPAQQSIVPKDMDNFIKSTTFLHTNCQVIMAITLNSHELIEIIDNLKPDTYQKINITGKAFQLLP